MIRLLLSALICRAESNWPQFRGPGGLGIGTEKPPVEFGPEKNVLWKIEVPHGHSSPCIWGGKTVLAGFDCARFLPHLAVNPGSRSQVQNVLHRTPASCADLLADNPLRWNSPTSIARLSRGVRTRPNSPRFNTNDFLSINVGSCHIPHSAPSTRHPA